jgi:enoyl-CoA hydratase
VRALRQTVADGADPAAAAEILEGLADELRTPFEQESKLSSVIFRTDDAKEGPRAFAEKRPPVWRSR